MSRTAWLAISVAWLVGSFGGGAILAWFYRRLHPGLSFHKLWALWTVILSVVAALVFALDLA